MSSRGFDYIGLELHIAGCPNRCRHCKDDGAPPCGELMTLEDAAWVARQFRSMRGEAFPMVYHEITAHPAFPHLWRLRAGPTREDPEDEADALATNGYGIARDSDYRRTLAGVREAGTKAVSLTLHGLEDHHDWFVCRAGAFRDIATAAGRAAECGLEVFFNVYLDRRNVADFAPLLEWIDGFAEEAGQSSRPSVCVPSYVASRRLRAYETGLRPRLSDLEPLRPTLSELWGMPLEAYTEGELTRRTLADPDDPSLKFLDRADPGRRSVLLFVDGAFDVYERAWHFDREPVRRGNLRADGLPAILDRLEARRPPDIPGRRALAERYGDVNSPLIHPQAFSVEVKWIDGHLGGRQRPVGGQELRRPA